MNILIPGGSGQIGRILARHFHERGDSVTVLARRPTPAPWTTLIWDGETLGAWARALHTTDIVINLAGRSVDCRYTPAGRRAILNSRVHSTQLLGEAIAQSAHPPALWMNASTATIYRHALDRPMDELTGELGGNEPNAPDTWRFSIDVATAWERAFTAAETPRTRKIALRSAMVMSPSPGGVFDVLLRLVRFGLGGAAGNGDQFVSWIHDRDFTRALEFLIAHEDLSGAINLASPNPLPNRDFMRALREANRTSIGLPAATWMLEIGALFLRTETELILKSRRVIPTRLLQAGFEFQFPHWPEAARELIVRRKS
ncbi:MAG TPA: TIGR01777 family oxidoreductase [Candidatus Solibacter sp.]|nr:TIGR01777 family oxidoreductase [Candidatus Solibacter sp.]